MDGYNYELILQTAPDLILAMGQTWVDPEAMKQLAEIAPALEFESTNSDDNDWRDRQRFVGQALDLSDASETAISEAESRAKTIIEEHPEFEGQTLTMSVDYGPEWGMTYYTRPDSIVEQLFAEFGFERGPHADKYNNAEDEGVSEENITDLDADALIVGYFDQEDQDARESGEVFQQMPAVADGRYYPIAGDSAAQPLVAALRFGASTASYEWIMETIANDVLADFKPAPK